MKNYKIDGMHSEIVFKVKHLLISTVSGRFKIFDGELARSNDDFQQAKVSFAARVDSIDTGNEQRDGHLKTGDFFDAEKYPEIKFESKSFNKKSDEKYEVTGDLTIRDITKTISLDVNFNGEATDGYGNKRIGFDGKGQINRKDFGLTFSMTTEAGTIVVGDEIKLEFNAQFIRQ